MSSLSRSRLIEVEVTSTTERQIMFSDKDTVLNNVVFTGISLPTASVGTTPAGRTIVTDAIAKRTFLTLRDSNEVALVYRMPLEEFFNTTGQNRIPLADLKVDVRKSYLEIFDTTGLTTAMSFLINFNYRKP